MMSSDSTSASAPSASKVTSHPVVPSGNVIKYPPATETAAPGPALPLGWTQIQRRREPTTTPPQDMEWLSSMCCDDRNCRRRRLELCSDPAASTEDIVGHGSASTNTNNKTVFIVGTAVICLPDPDSDWFQGYLFVSTHNYFGLLGIVQEIDECLQCAEGGYRELILQVTEMGQSKTNKKKWEFQSIAWTGGDMMRLQTLAKTNKHVPTVSMEADRVDTGMPAAQLIQELFGSLLRRLRQGPEEDDNDSNADTTSSVADLMPNAAVVTGRMKLRIPHNNNNNQQQNKILDYKGYE